MRSPALKRRAVVNYPNFRQRCDVSKHNINVGVRTRWFDLGTGGERVKMRRAMLNWYFPQLRLQLRAQGFDVKAPMS